jgi:hypothetical protein
LINTVAHSYIDHTSHGRAPRITLTAKEEPSQAAWNADPTVQRRTVPTQRLEPEPEPEP